MKISGSKLGGTKRVASAPGGQPRQGQSFAVSAGATARETAPSSCAASVGGVNSLDALLALQELEGPLERRRRAMRRASRILDVLDEMKLDLLAGSGDPKALKRLMHALREERSVTDDDGLEGLLDQIETRAAVELAKREARAA